MSMLRARCIRCAADLALPVTEVVVATSADHAAAVPSEVLFTCRGCGTTTLRHLDRGVAAVLVAGGAAYLTVEPATAPEPLERRPEGLGPLTLDDLLTLHEELAAPDWLAHLQAGSDPAQS